MSSSNAGEKLAGLPAQIGACAPQRSTRPGVQDIPQPWHFVEQAREYRINIRHL